MCPCFNRIFTSLKTQVLRISCNPKIVEMKRSHVHLMWNIYLYVYTYLHTAFDAYSLILALCLLRTPFVHSASRILSILWPWSQSMHVRIGKLNLVTAYATMEFDIPITHESTCGYRHFTDRCVNKMWRFRFWACSETLIPNWHNMS